MELPEEPYKTQQLGHLGLVAATIKELGLIDKINERLPLDKKKGGKVSHGHRSAAMLLNGLGYTNRTLYLSPHFFEDKPLDLLLGIDVTHEDLNDDMLGRNLDAIVKYGPTKLFSEIMYEVCTEQDLWKGRYNLDSTSLSLYGDYENYPNASPLPMLGYSKDHRPDLKQITVTLTQVSEANLPIWYEANDGNSSDKRSFQDTLKLMTEFQSALASIPDNIPFIVDAAFYTPEKLKALDNVTWLTRVPANYNEVKYWLNKADKEIKWTKVDEHNKLYSFAITHEGIAQRWALIDSAKGRAKAEKTFLKKLDKEHQKQSKALWHLCNQTFACSADAEKAMLKFARKLEHHQLHYEVVPVLKYASSLESVGYWRLWQTTKLVIQRYFNRFNLSKPVSFFGSKFYFVI
jgi:transposase